MEPEAGELVQGKPVEEVLSYERVGKLGEACLVVGELQRGPAPGSYVLRGKQGGPAMLVLGTEGVGTGQHLARRAWGFFSAAGALSVAAAFVLSRTLLGLLARGDQNRGPLSRAFRVALGDPCSDGGAGASLGQHDNGATETTAGEPRAMDVRVFLGEVHEQIDLRDRDLIVAALGVM